MTTRTCHYHTSRSINNIIRQDVSKEYTNETAEAIQGYLMQSIKAEFEELYALNMRHQNIPKYNIFNEQFK